MTNVCHSNVKTFLWWTFKGNHKPKVKAIGVLPQLSSNGQRMYHVERECKHCKCYMPGVSATAYSIAVHGISVKKLQQLPPRTYVPAEQLKREGSFFEDLAQLD